MERRKVYVINAITGIGLKYEESEVTVNVCLSILDMQLESEQIGETRGKQIWESKRLRKAQRDSIRWG